MLKSVIRDRIAVQPIEQQTKSGLLLPEVRRPDSHIRATVVAVGSLVGEYPKVGDTVLVSDYVGARVPLSIDSRGLRVYLLEDILALDLSPSDMSGQSHDVRD